MATSRKEKEKHAEVVKGGNAYFTLFCVLGVISTSLCVES